MEPLNARFVGLASTKTKKDATNAKLVRLVNFLRTKAVHPSITTKNPIAKCAVSTLSPMKRGNPVVPDARKTM